MLERERENTKRFRAVTISSGASIAGLVLEASAVLDSLNT